jgi:hypothetical protein
MTLFMVAASLFVLLGTAGLAIDLVSLYVARSEAQKAADAAALAGAKAFVDTTFITGGVLQSQAQAEAREQAKTVGGENTIIGQPVQIADADVTFNFSNPQNPRITVQVNRTTATGNPVPTLFMKAFGVTATDVSVLATAEAYSSSGGGPPVCTGCLKPWILPNCDPDPAHGGSPTSCTANYVNESTGAVVNPGPYPNGVIGQLLTLKYGQPQEAPAPSQFYAIQIPPGTDPAVCPACAQDPGGSEGPGAAIYRHNISCCNTNRLYCGQTVAINLETGNMVGPTGQGVRCLIHQGNGNSGGQDILDPTVSPFTITGGSNNPIPGLQGQIITSSDSIVTVPLYDGHELCPGGSCGTSVTIVGFMQMFVRRVTNPQNTVEAYILNVSGCGAGGGGTMSCGTGGSGGGGGGGGGGPVGSGYTPFPVRLIRL